MTSIQILKMEKPGDLFQNDIHKCKKQYKDLVKQWHPDICKEEFANEVFIKINNLYAAAIEMIEHNIWEKSNFLILETSIGKKIEINYLDFYDFEIGRCYICKSHIIYVFHENTDKYIQNMKRCLEKIKTINDHTKEMLLLFPNIQKEYKLKDNRICIVIKKDIETVPLKNILQYYNKKIPVEHVSWIISRLLNIACFLQYHNLVHNGINLENCFISPKNHAIYVFGGWWYCTGLNEKMIGTTKDIFQVMPISAKNKKTAQTTTDLESIKLLAKQLLSELIDRNLKTNQTIPIPISSFLTEYSQESAYEEYEKWEKTIEIVYGKKGTRKFTHMDINKDIYRKE